MTPLKPFSFYLPSAVALAAVGLLTAAPSQPAYAQKAAPMPLPVAPAPSPVTPALPPAIPISIEEQARSLNVSVKVVEQFQAVMADKETWTPVQQKLDSQLIYAARKAQTGVQIPGRPDIQLGSPLVIDDNGRVVVMISATVTDGLLSAIGQVGGQVDNAFPEDERVKAVLPLTQVEAIAARSEVRNIYVYRGPHFNTGSVTTEGDVVHQAATARTTFSATGQNQIIGVLSNDDTYLATSKSNGNIPAANVTVITNANGVSQDGPKTPPSYIVDYTGTYQKGEGTAMMEIVQDIAPGSKMLFGTASGGQAAFASNIRRMVDNYGATILVDDAIYEDESAFQDDVVAQAVIYAISKGVLYFSAAGNFGNLYSGTPAVWEGDFSPGASITSPGGAVTGVVHQYNTSATGTYNQALTYSSDNPAITWSDPQGKSTNDYDVFTTDTGGTTLRAVSTNAQTGTQNPYERAYTPGVGDRIYIVQKSGAAPRMLRVNSYFYQAIFGAGKALAIATSGQTFGHSTVDKAFSVAAADYYAQYPGPFSSATTNEIWSSDGPRRIFYNADGSAVTTGNFLANTGGGVVRQKPDLTAADFVSTSVTGFDTINQFPGTSASAAHAAGIAALIKSTNGMFGKTFIKGSALTYDEFRTTLLSPAIDIGVTGVDVTSGYGIAMPLASLNFLRNLAQNVVVRNIRNNSVTITWTTSLPAASTITYAPGASSGGLVLTDPTYTTTHSAVLGGLIAGTKYAFSIGANTQTGSVLYNSPADLSFTTTGLGPTTTLTGGATASALRSGSDVIVTVNIINSGTGIANNVTLTSGALNGVPTKTALPFIVGTGLYPNASLPAPLRFVYPAGKAPGSTVTVTFGGTLANPPTSGYTFSGTATVKLP